MERIISVILGGGRGQRLYPLTARRAKPAVPFGGKYRLVDIPISNCLHAELRRIFLLTQFNSASLHRHIANTYRFDTFTKGFVELLAAEQTPENQDWYLGTADAVRQNFQHLETDDPTHCIILSGDQLYRMDLMAMYRQHVASGADVTIAAIPVPRDRATGLGILQVDPSYRVTAFVEKPAPERDISDMRVPAPVAAHEGLPPGEERYLASMGIYVFSMPALRKALDNSLADFGAEVIPAAISTMHVGSYVFEGYWEDIGTILSFYHANLNLASINPDFNLYLEEHAHLHRAAQPPALEDQLQHHRAEPRRRGLDHHQRDHQPLHRGHPHDHRDGRHPRRGGVHGGRLLRDRGAERGQPRRGRPERGHRQRDHRAPRHHRQERAHRRKLPHRHRRP